MKLYSTMCGHPFRFLKNWEDVDLNRVGYGWRFTVCFIKKKRKMTEFVVKMLSDAQRLDTWNDNNEAEF